MRIISFTAIALGLLASSAQAGIFGPSDQEIQNALQGYFNRPGVTMEDYEALDLSILKTEKDASVLAYHLGRQIGVVEKKLEAERAKMHCFNREIEKYFMTLYRKEVRDEFYAEIRPSKQGEQK